MISFRVCFQGLLEQMFGLFLMAFGWVLMDVKKFKFTIATPSEQGDKVIHQKGLHEQEFSPYLHESGADKKNGCFLLLSYKQIVHTGKTNKISHLILHSHLYVTMLHKTPWYPSRIQKGSSSSCT
jgi:hypothetical protein